MASPVRRSTRAALVPEKRPQPMSNTSSSSSSSTKAARGKGGIPKSGTPPTPSSDGPSEPPRRSKRAIVPLDEDVIQDTTEHDGDPGEEEEVTRCICGQQDYPGPPESEAFTAAEAQSEDAGGLFIQCDGCSVWQHGGCVGIVEESQCPDKYYCEECRPKLHSVHLDSRDQRYSLYLPLHPKASHRKSSVSKYEDKSKREREILLSRGSTEPGRRRATMRSKEHDDEEEQLQRAIEESKRENSTSGTGRRSGKRSRDDSEDSNKETKRLRRASGSAPSIARTTSLEYDSQDENGLTLTVSKVKKARAEAALTMRNTELREKEKVKALERAEAAGRRQERAGRRRVEEGESLDDTPKASTPPPSSQPSPPPVPAVAAPMHRKGFKKTKKLGNNQYTKARELAAAGLTSPPHPKRRLLASQTNASGDENAISDERKNSPIHEPQTNGIMGRGKPGKGKNKGINGANKQPTSEELENMKSIPNQRRAMEAMQAFISKTQLELAGNETPPGSDVIPRSNGTGAAGLLDKRLNGIATSRPADDGGKDFNTLSAIEMADVLSRNIHKWQSRFAAVAPT